MKHILNNVAQGELAPWVTLDSEGVHYSCGVEAEDPNYVDLGLPSGTLWAKCNVGAENEWEYGKYFQWGDTVGRTADEAESKPCDWSTAPFNNGSSSYDEAYFASVKDTVCPNGVLASEYDAVHVHMGGNQRMPTTADTEELVNNTTNEWVTDYKDSGVNGRLFTSKTNGNTLFIPAVGFCYNGSVYSVGSEGYVWSSSLFSSNPNGAYSLYFLSSSVSHQDFDDRCYGCSVRGVKSK